MNSDKDSPFYRQPLTKQEMEAAFEGQKAKVAEHNAAHARELEGEKAAHMSGRLNNNEPEMQYLDNPLMALPTGTGKTLHMAAVAHTMGAMGLSATVAQLLAQVEHENVQHLGEIDFSAIEDRMVAVYGVPQFYGYDMARIPEDKTASIWETHFSPREPRPTMASMSRHRVAKVVGKRRAANKAARKARKRS